jgi:hypothetical protein
MKTRLPILCLVSVGLMAACAAVLARSQGMFQLGKPALRIVDQPIYDPDGKVGRSQQIELPETIGNWNSKAMPVSHIELSTLPPDTTFGRRRYFTPAGEWFDLSVVLMGTDRTSIHRPEYCLPGQGFVIDGTRSEITAIPIGGAHPFSLPVWKMYSTKRVKTPDGREETFGAVYVFWFVADGEITANHLDRMLRMGWHMIQTGVLQRWAYVSCFAVCRPGEQDATFARIKEFLAAAVPKFQLTGESAVGSLPGR